MGHEYGESFAFGSVRRMLLNVPTLIEVNCRYKRKSSFGFELPIVAPIAMISSCSGALIPLATTRALLFLLGAQMTCKPLAIARVARRLLLMQVQVTGRFSVENIWSLFDVCCTVLYSGSSFPSHLP